MDGISDAVCGLVDGMSTAGMAFVKEHAAGEISPGRLRRYLCDEACSPGQKEVRAEACRSCESACAYGRRFLRLLDAGEITTEGKAVKRQINHGKGEEQKMGQAPKENKRTGKTRQPAQAAERTASSMAGRPECGTCEPSQVRQTSGDSERIQGMGPGMEASGNCAAYLHSADRPEGGTCEPPQGRQTSGDSERMPGMGPGMEASGNRAAYLHGTGRPEGGTCEQQKAPTDLEIMEALKAENEELFAKLMAAEGENADMRMEKAADELTILKLKARLYDVLLGDQEENRQ